MPKKTCFVISPIEKDPNHYSNVFFEGIVMEELQEEFEIIRADKILSTSNILDDIIKNLENADLVVADLSELNPNVFYELGIRTHADKPIIQFTQDIESLPFDLKPIRTITYDTTFFGVKNARKKLKKFVENIDFNDKK